MVFLEVEVRQWSDVLYATYLLGPGDQWGSYVGMAETPELAAVLGDEMRAMPLCGCGHAEWAHVPGTRGEMSVRTWCSHYESRGGCHCKSFEQHST